MKPISFDKPLKIDTRPLWLIVMDRSLRYQLLGGLVLLTVIAYNQTPPSGLSAAGYHALVLFGVTITLWVSGLLPIAVTALLSMVMLPLAGILPAKQTYALFGNEAVFFINLRKATNRWTWSASPSISTRLASKSVQTFS